MPDAAAHKLQETVDQITGYRKRTRKLVVGLVAVTVVSLLVAGLGVYLFVRLHDSDIRNCQAGNQARAQQEQLWETLLTLSAQAGTAKPTPKARQLTGEFLQDVKTTFAQVDCEARYPFY